MKLPFLSNSKSVDPKNPSSSSWPWPSCTGNNIKTISFRAKDHSFNPLNSTLFDTPDTPLDSFFTFSSDSRSFSTMSEDSGDDPVEVVIRGLRSERLFFDPEESSSILAIEEEEEEEEEEEKKEKELVKTTSYKDSLVLSMESNDPFWDFKKSMEEMVVAHGVSDFEGLEELLGCYLKINEKNNHGYIISAFIDILIAFSFNSFSSSCCSSSSSSSCNSIAYDNNSSSSFTTPCISSLDHVDDDENDEINIISC